MGIEKASLLHKDLHGKGLAPSPLFQLLANVVKGRTVRIPDHPDHPSRKSRSPIGLPRDFGLPVISVLANAEGAKIVAGTLHAGKLTFEWYRGFTECELSKTLYFAVFVNEAGETAVVAAMYLCEVPSLIHIIASRTEAKDRTELIHNAESSRVSDFARGIIVRDFAQPVDIVLIFHSRHYFALLPQARHNRDFSPSVGSKHFF